MRPTRTAVALGPGRGDGFGQRAGLRLWLGLGTLIGADQRPGEVLGWGPVHAQLAVNLALSLPSWWCVITDPAGTVEAIVPVRGRPTGAASRAAPDRRYGEVWLQVDPDTLNRYTELDRIGRLAPDWSRIIAEITSWVADTRTGPPNGDPTARLPGAALRRWIAVRDRYCTFRGCRTPAHRADADHIIEYAQGGQTIDVDLAPARRHDHLLRTDGQWTVTQLTPGRVVWMRSS